MTEGQIIIVGGGHNGLACAAYLAKAGKRVHVLEAAARVGGAAITREFEPGYKVSACAHLLNVMDRSIVKELQLEKHGLSLAANGLETVALAENGTHLMLSRSGAEGGGVGAADKEALTAFGTRMGAFAGLLEKLYARRPPRLQPGNRSELIAAGRMALDLRLLGRDDMRELLRIGVINVYDVLEESFDNELLKGALAFDGVLGAHLGPRSNNSVLNYLHRLTGGMSEWRSGSALPRGGMGSFTAALSAAAQAYGASVRMGARVGRIVLDAGKVAGVELENGELISADTVVSNADPKTTFFDLLGARHLEAGFAHRVHNIRMRGDAARLHLALDGLPDFTGLSERGVGQRLVIAPSPGYVERAFDCAKYRRFSDEPTMEITLPSVHDDGLAPAGRHVLSATVQYAPYGLEGGWDAGRDAFQARAIDTIARYAPNIRERIVAAETLTPVDIEREFGINGGHWHHGELAFDQFLMLRPVPGAAQYASPVPGLYLCGAGCHAGGGVSGAAGRNAAREVLAGESRE